MSSLALLFVLIAAVCHAGWNLAAKKAGGGLNFALMASLAVGLLWAPINGAFIFFSPQHSPWGWSVSAWIFVGLSAVLHAFYFVILLKGYRSAPLSLVYPIARGSGPLLSACLALVLFDERLSSGFSAGVAFIASGIAVLTFEPRSCIGEHAATLRTGIFWGCCTGLFISAYTLTDAYAVKTLRLSPMVYDYCVNVLRAAALLPFASLSVPLVRGMWRENKAALLAVSILSPLAYILVLFAMQIAPVSHVVPARELSLVFGAFFGSTLFGEGQVLRRTCAASLIAAGVAALTLL
jgi:drug/metabolite transporter (DMT)-like permease